MHKTLIRYINRFVTTPLSAGDERVIESIFVPKKLRKRQYLLQEGEVCKYSGFIVKGAMRQYSVDEKGAEHVVRLSIEGWWVGDRDSYVNLTPSVYNIDAWEDTDALLITKADSLELFEQIPAMVVLARKLDDQHAIAIQRRLNAAISLSAKDRYTAFANTYPEFLQRFPQHIIASYLGITKETLSRIRKQLVKH